MNLSNLFSRESKIFDVSSVKFKKPIDEQLTDKLINYIQLSSKHLSKLGLSKIMVGVYDDTNSLAALVLLKQVLKEDVLVVMIIDCGSLDTNNLAAFCNKLSVNSYILDRQAAYQGEISAYSVHHPTDIRCFYKRFINYHLLIQADKMGSAVIDTADKSDRLLGTRPEGFYGHFMPFYSLYKSELFDLASLLGMPEENKSSSTSFQDLPYPDNLLLTFDKIDPVLFLLIDKQLDPEEISKAHNIDLHWLKKLKSRIDKQTFKTTISKLII